MAAAVLVGVGVFVAVLVTEGVGVLVGFRSASPWACPSALLVGVAVGVRVGVLKIADCATHSVLEVSSLPVSVKPATAAPTPIVESCVAMNTIVWQVAGLVQSPSSRKPSALACVGGTLLPGARLPMVDPSVSS